VNSYYYNYNKELIAITLIMTLVALMIISSPLRAGNERTISFQMGILSLCISYNEEVQIGERAIIRITLVPRAIIVLPDKGNLTGGQVRVYELRIRLYQGGRLVYNKVLTRHETFSIVGEEGIVPEIFEREIKITIRYPEELRATVYLEYGYKLTYNYGEEGDYYYGTVTAFLTKVRNESKETWITEEQIKAIQEELSRLLANYTALKADYETLYVKYQDVKTNYDSLAKEYLKLQEQYNNLLATTSKKEPFMWMPYYYKIPLLALIGACITGIIMVIKYGRRAEPAWI